MHIIWFRHDLRIHDNPALSAAIEAGQILPIYIFDQHLEHHKMGAASQVWLHHALADLNQSLDGHLQFFEGNSEAVFEQLIENYPVEGVYWNRGYDPERIAKDKRIKKALQQKGINAESYHSQLLCEPWQHLKADNTPYKVFTPFYKSLLTKVDQFRIPLAEPDQYDFVQTQINVSITLDDLALLPNKAWGKSIVESWQISEHGAGQALADFQAEHVTHYAKGRDLPAQQHTSRLSPYLHFGQLSPMQVWQSVSHNVAETVREPFLRQLVWREFSHHLLYHFPQLPNHNLQSQFDRFPWQWQSPHLTAWQRGQTGIPIVDAGMRELWQTGYMHNRVRMVVGSFLVKNLGIHWQLGEQWFWDCLFDADMANNSASWQWVAGCGTDAAPYFRIFNPVTQGEKFDNEGDYTRRYVPELADLPNKYLFSPWTAPDEVLDQAGIVLGETYPEPVVDLKASRAVALDNYQQMKQS